ncbi:MAG TPA: TIGR03435 family protein [Candidatus Acidoferrales bacterium]|nr:TIGR03435 family protein [Candidatus Acidoferrales bacterium]
MASIKPVSETEAAKASKNRGMRVDSVRVNIGSFSLLQLIVTAYQLRPYQVSGPDWIKSTRFDIVAKIPEQSSEDRVPEMLQALLADRFKLVVHRATRETPVYALVVVKDKLKLIPTPPEPAPGGSPSGSLSNGPAASEVDSGRDVKYKRSGDTLHLKSAHMTMADLARYLAPFVDRPVVDMTNLEGAFAVNLEISADDLVAAKGAVDRSDSSAGVTGPSDPVGSSVFAALQKLGLKLERQKSPVEYIIIDHIERIPTPN